MPKVVLRGRGGGKTIELIKQCADKGGYIVVHSRDAATYVQKAAEELGLKIPFPITYDELMKGQLHGRHCSPLWIDNVDILLRRLTEGASLGGWSATVEMESE